MRRARYADRLGRRGYDLIPVARDRDRLDALAKRIGNTFDRHVEVRAADLGNRSELEQVEATLPMTTASRCL